MNTKNLGPIHD